MKLKGGAKSLNGQPCPLDSKVEERETKRLVPGLDSGVKLSERT